MRDYALSKRELALLTFFMVFGALCLPGELLGGRWGANTIARFAVAGAAAIVAVVARRYREAMERVLPPATWSVSEWRSAPDVTEYARQALSAPEYVATPLEMQLGGILVAAGLPVSRECEYKVIVRVKGNG